ncbi:MAG: UvrB/UvrC motif-containing protein, partial [Anaerolineae bacterium]|nr:UvrB/UvrC motif-containing protein [Anaerolineae bacterium]
RALDETARRRAAQAAYNAAHGITPQTIRKAIGEGLIAACEGDWVTVPLAADAASPAAPADAPGLARRIAALRAEMRAAARALEFERAAALRDQIRALEARLLELPVEDAEAA